MNIIHTADWHLGQSFYDYDRKAEHLVFLEWLASIIKEHNIDALLIAGDIFDNPNPSADSQKIYYHFLREVTAQNPNLQIVIIAGNHDSAARLEAPNPLLQEMNITVKGVIKRSAEDGEIDFNDLIVPLRKNGEVAALCLAVPYLRQGDYPASETYAAGVKAMYQKLYEHVANSTATVRTNNLDSNNQIDSDQTTNNKINSNLPKEYRNFPVIAMGHLQATGSEISENDRSEKAIIGGLEAVSPDAFSQETLYTALGHLHKTQRVSGRENVRYAGSPLPISFSEKNYNKGVNLISFGESNTARENASIENTLNNFLIEGIPHLIKLDSGLTIKRLEFKPPAKLISLTKAPAPLNEILEAIDLLPDGEISQFSPYLEIKVAIEQPEPALRHTIEEALKGKAVRLTRVEAVVKQNETSQSRITFDQLKTISPLEIAQDVFGKKYGGNTMSQEMEELFIKAIDQAHQQ